MTLQTSWQKIQQALKHSIGLNVAAVGRSNIERAVQHRMKILDLSSLEEYAAKLTAPTGELAELIEEVVVPETWFMRNPEAFTALAEIVRGNWFEFNMQNPLRILSVPCSTGEEAYSIAMTIADEGLNPGYYSIDAVDVSDRALSKAREGCYGKHSFRNVEGGYRERYFEKINNSFSIIGDLRKPINFQKGNLLDTSFSMLRGHYHIIFCRNLLIYFDRQTQIQSIDTLCGLLLDDGVLFLGHAETGDHISSRLQRLPHERAFAYQRRLPERLARQSANGENTKQAESPGSATATAEIVDTAPIPAPPGEPSTRGIPAVLPQIPEQEDPELSQVAQYANEGELIQAEFLCRDYLNRNDTSAQGYYLLALIYEAQGRSELVENLYRKTIYLDPEHYEALIHLAQHAIENQEMEIAARLRGRARRVFERRKLKKRD